MGGIEDAVPHLEHRGPAGRRGHPRHRRQCCRGGARATKHRVHRRDTDIVAKISTPPTRSGEPRRHLQADVTVLEFHAARELWSMSCRELRALTTVDMPSLAAPRHRAVHVFTAYTATCCRP
jgi:hypothetical protein